MTQIMFRHKQGLHTYTLKVCTNVNDLIFDLKKIIIKKKTSSTRVITILRNRYHRAT